MKFDVIIGNPPYQMNDGGGVGSSAKPIYHKFIENAIELQPKYICMITPSRWMFGGKGLDEFRKKFLNDKRLKIICDFEDSKECFPSVDIKGGVNYFLWDSEHNGDCLFNGEKRNLSEFNTFIRSQISADILNKVKLKITDNYLDKIVLSRNPFGINSNYKNYEKEYSDLNNIKLYGNKNLMKETNGIGYINPTEVIKNIDLINKYKLIIPKASGTGFDAQVLTNPIICEKKSVCSETYLVLFYSENKEEVINFSKYLKTKFFRFLVSLKKTTQNSTKESYEFVPNLNTNKEWNDEELFKYFNLSENEIKYINDKINEMK